MNEHEVARNDPPPPCSSECTWPVCRSRSTMRRVPVELDRYTRRPPSGEMRGASIAAPDANSSALTCGAAAQLPAEPVSQSAPATPAPRATRIAPPAAPPTQRCV